MAFLKASRTGMSVLSLHENSGYNNEIVLRGFHNDRIVRLNGNDIVTNTSRGMAMVIINDDLSIAGQGVYDLYGSSNARSLFVSRLSGILPNQIALLASRGFIETSTDINNVFIGLGSLRWPHGLIQKGIKDLGYAAIVNGSDIVYETNAGNGINDIPADLKILFDSIESIGQNGFGQRIIEDVQEYSDSGSNLIYQTLVDSPLSEHHLSPGDSILSVASFRVNETAFLGGIYSRLKLKFTDGTNTLGEDVLESNAVGGWEKKDLVSTIPANTTDIVITLERSASGGEVSATNITVTQASEFEENSPTKIGSKGIASESIYESAGVYPTQDSSVYFNSFQSPQNLHSQVDLEQHTSEDVIWYTRTLLNNNEKLVTKTGTSVTRKSASWIEIDETQPYWISIWCRKNIKDAGSLKFGVDLADENMDPIAGNYSNADTSELSPVLEDIQFDDVQDDYFLFSAWILPSTWTAAQGQEFIDSVKTQYGDINDQSGVGIDGETVFYHGTRMLPGTKFVKLVMSDNDNTTISDIKWAIPIIRKATIMSVNDTNISFLNHYAI